MKEPCAEHPKQLKNLRIGLTKHEGLLSAWKGQRIFKSPLLWGIISDPSGKDVRSSLSTLSGLMKLILTRFKMMFAVHSHVICRVVERISGYYMGRFSRIWVVDGDVAFETVFLNQHEVLRLKACKRLFKRDWR